MFFFTVNLLLCSVNAELKHKTTGSHASAGTHGFSCPTCQLEIEMNYTQYCYSFSFMVVVIRSLPTLYQSCEVSAR